MAVRALLVGAPHHWKYVEADFFCSVFQYDLEEWQSVVQSIGPEEAYAEIVTALSAASRSPDQAEALLARNELALVQAFRTIFEAPDFGVAVRPVIPLKKHDDFVEPLSEVHEVVATPKLTAFDFVPITPTVQPKAKGRPKKRPVGPDNLPELNDDFAGIK